MSDARGILDQRLAKGEITEGEYDRLVDKLGPKSAAPTQAPPKKAKSWVGVAWLITAASVIYIVSTLGALRKDNNKLEVSNISASATGWGTNVRFRLVNNSTTAGEAVFWVKLNGNDVCPYLVNVTSKQVRDFTLPCDQIRANDKFHLMRGWAKDYGRLSRAATRIK